MSQKTSQLIRDLTQVPNIIGNLGLSIAAAQKAFNLSYIESLETLVALIKSLLGSGELDDNSQSFFKDLLTKLAPPQYQFTETTLSVRLDLAQSLEASGSAGLGVGLGGVALNAAFTAAYGYDYRAAAEVKTVLHARPLDTHAMDALLKRAADFNDKVLDLPALPDVDTELLKSATKLAEKVSGVLPAAPKPATEGDGEGNEGGGNEGSEGNGN